MKRLSEWMRSVIKKGNMLSLTGAGLFVLGALLIGFAVFSNFFASKSQLPESPVIVSSSESSSESSAVSSAVVSSSQPEEEAALLYPTDRLFITRGRQEYTDGAMILRVPRLDLEAPVMSGTDDQALKKSVGLYEYAQLPGEGNSNVSIAGHRDIYGCEFYYIDTVTDGDLLYLEYDGTLYTYRYLKTEIVEADDWGPIYSKEFSCLTLTSCHPIGTSQKRIIVTAELVSSAAQ
ncbi:class E sortase [Marasmitruncus massiliensis]|uniref:class E sortase n=1 Tax=Marasmitruncus massiliensis TaxID=1944642 RepID=UPI000C7C0F67|nr:class E sortase [Marasmitruncus massiliensis]